MTHTRRAPVQSAGKAPAHTLHETSVHSSRSAEKTSSRHGRVEEAPHNHASANSRKGTAPSRHARETRDDSRNEDSRHNTKAHAGRKRHESVVIDDPQPMHRARGNSSDRYLDRYSSRYPERSAREPQELVAKHKAVPPQAPAPEWHEARTLPPQPAVLPMPDGIPGNVARNNARRAALARGETLSDTNAAPQPANTAVPSRAFATGTAHPDEDDPLRSSDGAPTPAAPQQMRHPVPINLGRPATPMATVTAAPAAPAQPAMQPVEGFGGEVAYRSTYSSRSADHPTLIGQAQSETAEQAGDLREAAEAASQPMFVPMYSREGRLVVPPPLKGSRTILVHQNEMADDAGLSRIQDDADLNRMLRAHLLVNFSESASLRVNEGLPENRRAARPWAVRFAVDLASAFYGHFGDPLQVNSAVRTVAYQRRLQRVNGNAAATYGDGASPHLTGQAIDFGKRGMTVEEIAWMRTYLSPLIEAGKIDVEEEFQQACFHISVYASYMSTRHYAPVRTEVAQSTHSVRTHSAAANTAVEDEDLR